MGASRSGTTALTDYLNEQDEILICMERFKYVPALITPETLTFDRIADYEPKQDHGETNIPWERHEALLAKKDPAKIRWIGDKGPASTKRYSIISENNPGAHFLLTYRPIEEVVESFEDRAKNLDDPWIGGKDGLKMGVEAWNRSMRSAREYLEGFEEVNGLIVSYSDFFSAPRNYVPLFSEFLELEFDELTIEKWESSSSRFESGRREKEPITEAKAEYIELNKDQEAENWVLEQIARQWSEPCLYKQTVGHESGREKFASALVNRRRSQKTEAAQLRQYERRVTQLERELSTEFAKVASAEKRQRNLISRMSAVRSSRSWKFLSRVRRLRTAKRGSSRR
jgi:hypothetical protein